MGLAKTMWYTALLVVLAWSSVQCSEDINALVQRDFERLRSLADGVGWKPIVEPPQDEVIAIEEKARKNPFPDFEHDLRSKIGCSPGFTGVNCSNPICYNTSTILFHDGVANFGDDIEWDVSVGCNDTFYFPLDMYIGDVYMTIAAQQNSNPSGTLIGPNGMEVAACETIENGNTQWKMKFCNIVQNNSPGTYSFRVRSANGLACVYSVQGSSPLSADGGFVSDVRDDNVQVLSSTGNNGIERMPVVGVASFLAFALKLQHFPVQPTSVAFYDTGVYSQTYPVNVRYHCGAPYYVGSYTCAKVGFYHVKIRGTDADGNVWQRVYYFDCDASGTPTFPTGTPSTGPPPTECHNGGFLIPGTSSSPAVCYCPQYYTGPMCDTKLCFNDGFLASDGACVCRDGYSGYFCQDVQCTQPLDGPFDLSSRALVFVVRASFSMQPAFAQIVLAAQQVTDYYASHYAMYFREFVLMTFVNGTIPVIQQYPSAGLFISALQAISPANAGCDDAIFTALATVLQLPALAQYRRSPIFVFTDGVTNDGQLMQEALFHQLSFWRGQIYTVVTDPRPGTGCNIDTAQFGFMSLRYLARFTQGHVSYVQQSTIASLVFNIATNLYAMDFVLTNDLMVNCQMSPTFQPFFVDTDTANIVITATGAGITLSLTDPMLNTASMNPTYQQNGTYIWVMNSPVVGSYLLTITGAQAPCQYRVMARSKLDLFFGTSPDLLVDANSPQPIYRTDSHIVARVNGLNGRTSLDNVQAEVTISTNDQQDNRVVLYASNGVVRDRCAYFLYFGSWQCLRPFEQFYITVYATDNTGATFQRTATGFCSGTLPTPVPPNGCLNGGVDGPNGTCVCQPYFSGPKCQTISCMNGATATSGICQCPPGFSGQFCEMIMCYNVNQEGPFIFSPNGRSLTYIIHDSLFMRPVIKGLAQSAGLLVQDISQQHPGWIRHYQVLTFTDAGFKVYTESSDPSDFVNALNKVYSDNLAGTGFSCQNLSIIDTMNRALSSIQISHYGYMFVFTNGQASLDFKTMAQTYSMLEASKVQVNFIQSFSRPCGGQLTDPGVNIQLELPAFSGGDFFLMSVTKAASINSYVPTLYSGNYVYENYISDCTAPQSFYFPIDSHTQAYTIYTYGQLVPTGNTLTTPRGMPWGSDGMVNLWSDTSMNTRVDQIIRPCDPGWTDVVADGYCYKFIYQPYTWTQAEQICHAEGAILATVFDGNFESVLEGQAINVDFWIGLNDRDQEGVFVWDQLNGSIPLTSGMYKNWAPGQPTPDPGHVTNCVIQEMQVGAPLGKGWVPVNCNLTKPAVCIKRNYNYNYEPTFDSENDLPKGIWSLGVQTQTGPCYVKVYSQSEIQLYHQFVVNVHDDAGLDGAIKAANDNRMIAHVTHQEASMIGIEGQLQYLHIYKENLTIQDVEIFYQRSTCAFEYISTPFSCPAYNFNAMVTGIDSMGYLYQRIKPIFCMSGPTQYSCQHGGAFNNGRCYCQQYWTGQYCEQAICVNGGFPDASETACQCRPGWTGTFCQTAVCFPIVPALHRNNGNRTFVLVLDGASSTPLGLVLQNISATLTPVLTSVSQNYPNWFTRFVAVIAYDPFALTQGRNITSATITSTSIPDFVSQIAAALQPPAYYSGQCTRSTISALVQALNNPMIGYRDEVFVLTGSPAFDWQQTGPALNAITRTHSYVNFITVGDSLPCGTSYNDPGMEAYFDLGQISGGGFYLLTADILTNFWSSLLNSFYGSSWLTFSVYENCANITQYAQVGLNSSLLTVDIFGIDPPTLAVTDPNGTALHASLQGGQHSTLEKFPTGGTAGIYTFNVNQGSTTEQGKPCIVKVRGQSNIMVSIGFTQDVGIENGVHSDQVAAAPIAGNNDNALVATADGVGSLTYVQFLSLSDGSLLWSSPLQMRSGCAFLYISKVFTCPASSFAVAVVGTDFEGHPIRRITNIHCVGLPSPTLVPPSPTPSAGPTTTAMPVTTQTTTTQTPPTTTPLPQCNLKAAVVDLVVLFDASNGLGADDFKNTITNFFPLSSQVTIGGDFVRVAMGTYDVQPHFNGDFLSINNTSDYINKVNYLWNQPQTGIYGNNVNDALNAVVNLTTTAHGYRTGGNVIDMVLIISSTGWDQGNFGNGFSDPSATANTLRRAGMNVVAIGFGPQANMQQLYQISPCAQYAPNIQSFNALMPWIWSRFCLTGQQFC